MRTYPVMAGEHEVIGPGGAIPEGMLRRDDVDVVGDESFERGVVVRRRAVDEVDHVGDAEGEEERMSSRRIPCP